MLKTIMSSSIHHRSLALSAGIFIGALGIVVFHKIFQKVKRKWSNQNLNELELSIMELKEEIQALENDPLLCSSRLSLESDSSVSSWLRKSGFDTDDEMFSAPGSVSDEFFDLPSDEEFGSPNFLIKYPSCSDADTNNLFWEIDVALKGNDFDRLRALKLLEKNEFEYSENITYMRLMAKACQLQASAYGARNEVVKKKEYVYRGLAYAEKALTIDPSNPEVHKWYAILIGMKSEFLSVKDKIESGYTFQKHVIEALQGKPNDSTLHHLLGRFKYEVATLSWMEKKMAATLFTKLPDVRVSDALNDFIKAEKLNPAPWKENKLFIAKCHILHEDYAAALEWLKSAIEIPPITHEDRICDQECEFLILKYQK